MAVELLNMVVVKANADVAAAPAQCDVRRLAIALLANVLMTKLRKVQTMPAR